MNPIHEGEIAHGVEIPFEPDPVLGPRVGYGGDEPTAIYYVTEEDDPVRVTFERPDAIRICRGEYPPFKEADAVASDRFSVFVVEGSAWLRERHAYEARYYRRAYEWGGDVEVMLTEYDHYLFRFHDEYVEALALGIWFEKDPPSGPRSTLTDGHPLAGLPRDSAVVQYLNVGGVRYGIRATSQPTDELLWGGGYCSQPLFDFTMETGGIAFRVDLRVRRGTTKCVLRNALGTGLATIDGVPTLEQSAALAEPHLRALSESPPARREQG